MFYSLTATTNWAAFCQCMRAIKAAVAATATPAAAVKKAADPTRACKVSRTHTHAHTHTERTKKPNVPKIKQKQEQQQQQQAGNQPTLAATSAATQLTPSKTGGSNKFCAYGS